MDIEVVHFCVFMTVLWVTRQHIPVERAFTQFQDPGGWRTTALSMLADAHHAFVLPGS